MTQDFVQTQHFGKEEAATYMEMDKFFLERDALALLSIATIPRAHLVLFCPPPAKTSQTEYSRWGSPAHCGHRGPNTFARIAVTRRDLDAQPAPIKLTSGVQNPINAFTPV